MKKLLILATLLLTIMFGCAKEETKPAPASVDVISQDAYFFNTNLKTPSWEKTIIPETPNDLEISATNRSNSAHTHGNFIGFGGNVSITFSGTENNGGTHGTAVFEQTLNLPFPPFNATVVISMDTECVMVDGDAAVYGGTMTEVEGSPFPPGAGPFKVGNNLYFRVVDNGQGNNAPTDQYSGTLVISGSSRCGILVPSNPSWFSGTLPFPPFAPFPIPTLDVEGESDKIKVN